MENKKTIIEFKNIVKTYGNGDAKTYALNGVNFSIKEGEFVAIMGASGSGKSTAMNMIGCLDKPSSGEYLFNGINVADLNRNQMALLRRNFLGFVFQSFNLLGRTSALENVELPLVYRKIPAIKRKEMALDALTKVGLQSVVYNTPAQLSGGQQQRIALARMFLKNPPIIFLDEPTASLDAIAAEQIKNSLDEIKQGRTVIMISHSLSQIIDADYTYVMKEGQIVEHGEHHDLYHQDGTYKEIFDAMAKSLNIEKIAKTFDDDGEEETHS